MSQTMTEVPKAEQPTEEQVLRHLSPALRDLERGMRSWLDGRRRFPLSTEARAELERQAADLRRKADDIQDDKPLLVIVLMGGTGVGKSTLFNALAGDAVAQASFQRPTTRDPVVYYYQSIRPDRLDPALRHCRLVPHDHQALEQKVIVDTPDLDSNDLSNREKLARILPVADVVLYVGSQEKYHDKLGWDLFRQQRLRRAFAFVLNKWDRCTHVVGDGLRPDLDLLRDLRSEGFENPKLFRTCAQNWVDYRQARKRTGADGVKLEGKPDGLPEGEEFQDLLHWLELGITAQEIEAIKHRGVDQSLRQVASALTQVAPPDLTDVAARTREAWNRVLDEEAESVADVLLHTLEPYQREIEHHFALEGQRRFHGLMAWWLGLANRIKYVGSQLKSKIPLAGRFQGGQDRPAAWDLASFTRACSDVAANRSLDGRITALANRLLVEADGQGFPLSVLSDPVEATAGQDWRQRHAQTMVEALHEVEQAWTRPTGGKGLLQGLFIALCNWAPPLALLASCSLLLWRFFVESKELTLGSGLLPLIVVVVTLILCQVLIALFLPLRWTAIRGEFQRSLARHVREELEKVYGKIPINVSDGLRDERRQVELLLTKIGEIDAWLKRSEKVAIAELYGH